MDVVVVVLQSGVTFLMLSDLLAARVDTVCDVAIECTVLVVS